MKRVVLSAKEEDTPLFKSSVLSRDDVELNIYEDIKTSLHSLVAWPPDLIIIYDNYGTTLPTIISSISKMYPDIHFTFVVLTDYHEKHAFPDSVIKVFPTDVDLSVFNDSIAIFLQLPIRRSVRRPIRMGISLSKHMETHIVNTVTVSGSGMLIESIMPLTIGDIYECRFMGLPPTAEIPVITFQVLRLEPNDKPNQKTQNYAVEFQGISVESVESLITQIIPK